VSLANRAFALGPWPVSGDRGITRVAGPQPGPVGVADGDPSSLVLLAPVYLVSWLRRSSPARNREREEPDEIPATNLIQEAREGVSLDEFRRPGSLDPLSEHLKS